MTVEDRAKRRAESLQRLSRRAGAVVAGVAALVLIGWFAGIRVFKSVYPSLAPMKSNTAVGLLAAGLALWLHRAGPASLRRGRAALALLTALIGVATVFEHVTELDLGIDRLLPWDPPAGATAPGRMSPVTSVGLTLVGAALLLHQSGKLRDAVGAQALALTTFALFSLAGLGYLYGVDSLYAIPGYATVALHTALSMLVLAAGIVFARPDSGLLLPLTADTDSGRAARRLLPAVVVLPIVFGWLRLEGQRRGLYGTEFGLALFAMSNVLCLSAVTWWTASSLARLEQLRRANEELELERQQAFEVSRIKGEFLANMSHELRTPLNAVIGFADLVHRGTAGPLTPEQRDYLGEVLSSSRHLLSLIEDVLDLSRFEAGRVEPRLESVELATIFEEVRDGLRALAAERGLGLRLSLDGALGPVAVDRRMLKQILYNLVTNGLKFTAEGGQVELRASAEDAARFRIDVSDTGIGISADDLPRLFVEFQQLDAGTAKRYQGTGLGLALTKRLVEAHGGTVSVKSKPGEGSTFTVLMPRDANAA